MVSWKSLLPKSTLPPAEAVPVAAAAGEGSALALGFAFAAGDGENFGSVDVDHAGVDAYDGFRLFVAEAAGADAVPAAATSADVLVLGFVSELSDAADDDGVNAQQFSELCSGIWIGAIAIREILLGEDFVHGFAIDDGIGSVLDQIAHQEIGDALADVHLGAKSGGADGGKIEIEYRDALFAALRCRRCACGRCRCSCVGRGCLGFRVGNEKTADHQCEPQNLFHGEPPIAELSEEYGKTEKECENLTDTLRQVSTLARACPLSNALKSW